MCARESEPLATRLISPLTRSRDHISPYWSLLGVCSLPENPIDQMSNCVCLTRSGPPRTPDLAHASASHAGSWVTAPSPKRCTPSPKRSTIADKTSKPTTHDAYMYILSYRLIKLQASKAGGYKLPLENRTRVSVQKRGARLAYICDW